MCVLCFQCFTITFIFGMQNILQCVVFMYYVYVLILIQQCDCLRDVLSLLLSTPQYLNIICRCVAMHCVFTPLPRHIITYKHISGISVHFNNFITHCKRPSIISQGNNNTIKVKHFIGLLDTTSYQLYKHKRMNRYTNNKQNVQSNEAFSKINFMMCIKSHVIYYTHMSAFVSLSVSLKT